MSVSKVLWFICAVAIGLAAMVSPAIIGAIAVAMPSWGFWVLFVAILAIVIIMVVADA